MTLLPACLWVFASVYGQPQPTASGEWFTGKQWTIALPFYHRKSIPFGTEFFLTYNNKTIPVRYTDTGPFIKGRGADLSKAIANTLDFPGLGWVCLQKIN